MTTNNQNPVATNFHGVVLIMAALMPVMAIVSLVPVMPLLGREFSSVNGSEYLVPIALTIPALCLALFSPGAGWLADKFGRKHILVIALLCYSLVGTLPYFLDNLYQIIAARIALGIFEAAIMVIATTLVGDYFDGKARQKWLAIQVIAVSFAAILLVAIGGALGSELGSRGPFLLYIVAAPLALLCHFVLFEPLVRNTEENTKESVPVKEILPIAGYALILGILFYVSIVKLGPILALKVDISPALVGKAGAVTNGGAMLGALIFGISKKWLSAGKLASLAVAIMAIGYFGSIHFDGFNMTVFSLTLVCVGAGVGIPTFLSWAVSKLALSVRGRGIGIAQGAFFLGQFVAPITAVSLSKMAGGLYGALNIYAVIAVVMVFLLLLTTRNQAPLAEAIQH